MTTNNADAGVANRRLTGWVTGNSMLARRVYNAAQDGHLSRESDIDLCGSGYDSVEYLIRALRDKNAIVLVERGRPAHADKPDVAQYRLAEAFTAAVEAHTQPLADRDGLCWAPDCSRTHITWPDDAEGPRCPCGAELREDAVRTGGGGA